MNNAKKIIFKDNDREKKVLLNSENPYLKFYKIEVFYKDESLEINSYDISVSYRLIFIDNSEQTGGLNLNNQKNELIVISDITANWNNVKNIQLDLDIKNQELKNCEFYLYYNDFNYIENNVSKKDFAVHILNSKNNKILFSAPFGEGKSTFLKYFFEQNEDKYEVFKVFPVNYSVSSNEDIFRYIKTDVLFQFMGKDVEFQKESFSDSISAQQFIITKKSQVFKSLLKTGLSLTSYTKGIIKAIEGIEELIKDFKTFKKETTINDKQKALDYVEELYREEGSLYEDNFYTQLIRELVEQVKGKTKKETVLIIDDLDRMDPEHIFRILNVISAHCDSYNIQEEEFHNKFGFDKIIVVCDIKNIREIFEHRFGKKVNFQGYIDKFYSTEVFDFDSSILIEYLFNKLELSFGNNSFKEGVTFLKIFSELGLINSRDLIKTYSSKNFNQIYNEKYSSNDTKIHKYQMSRQVYFPFILVLVKQFGKTNLIDKLDFYKNEKSTTLERVLDDLCEDLLIGLISINSASTVHTLTIGNTMYMFEVPKNNHKIQVSELKIINKNDKSEEYTFTKEDFFNIFNKYVNLIG